MLNPPEARSQTETIRIDLTLGENQKKIIENGYYKVEGGLNLSGNSSLHIINARLIFPDEDEHSYTLTGNSGLWIINSTIKLGNPWSLQLSKNASITLINTEIYDTENNYNRTVYRAGIGLSGNNRITSIDSKVGFIRIADNVKASLVDSYIGYFGSQSYNNARLDGCIVERMNLIYDKTWIQINQSLTGFHESFNQSQIVKSGQTDFKVELTNTILLYPPAITIIDGKLETQNTTLDLVKIAGDSAIETSNTKIYYLELWDYAWTFIEDSSVDYLIAWRGDFNIHLQNTTHRGVNIYGTTGLNLKTNKTNTEYLNLDWSHPNTPQNVEIHETNIGDLRLTMLSPQPIQCNKVTIGNLTLESGWEDEQPITITGSIEFNKEAKINQRVKDGYTRIKRIYLIQANIDGEPAANKQMTIHLENKTYIINTNQEGEAILPVTYLRHIDVITNPQPGGPYLINRDNLTRPVIITLNNQNTTINLLSDTPVKIETSSGPTVKTYDPDWSQYTPAAVIITVTAIAIYQIQSQNKEANNRHIQ